MAAGPRSTSSAIGASAFHQGFLAFCSRAVATIPIASTICDYAGTKSYGRTVSATWWDVAGGPSDAPWCAILADRIGDSTRSTA